MRSTFICLSLVLIKPVSAIVHVRDERRSLRSLVGYPRQEKVFIRVGLRFRVAGVDNFFLPSGLSDWHSKIFIDEPFIRVFLARSFYVRIKGD